MSEAESRSQMSLATWWENAERLQCTSQAGSKVVLSVTHCGSGPHHTFLHGYPGSSYDWAAQITALQDTFEILAVDLLGFGASDKPVQHHYTIGEQADLVEQLWVAKGVTSTRLVVHDYSVSVAQELLCRNLAVELTEVVFTNGGIFPEHHRPTAGQQLLLSDDGEASAAVLDAGLLSGGLAETFGPLNPARPSQLDDLCAAMGREGGFRLAARLLHYVGDRRENRARWLGALASTEVPLSFIWGLDDPVSGAHMLEAIEATLVPSLVIPLSGVGHWPMLEVPALVSEALAQQWRR